MINFACRKISLEDVFRCALNLKRTDFKILTVLFKQERPLSSLELSGLINLDRTTIQKSLKSLLGKGLVKRYQRNLVSGGYTYLYAVKAKELIKQQVIDLLNAWCERVSNELINF